MDDPLRERARDAIVTARIPAHGPVRSWAGKGSGACCVICARPVTTDEVELELEFGDPAVPDSGTCHRVHAPCFVAWQLECGQ